MPRTDQFPAFSGPLNDDDELFVLDHGETVTQKDKRINVAHARRQLVKAAFMEPRNPGPNDDETQDYATGNFGINTSTGALFTLVDASAGAAVWADAGSTFSGNAEDVTYDPTESGLTATDVQAALDELAQNGDGGGGNAHYDPQLGYPGQPEAGAADVVLIGRDNVTIEAADPGEVSVGTPPADGPAVIDVRVNGVSVGTFEIDASGAVTWSVSGDIELGRGDLLSVVAPDPADSALADVLVAFRGVAS